MKAQTSMKLVAAMLALAGAQTAWSQDAAPAKPATAEDKAQPAASAAQPAKPAVLPHNHMRDGKGQWVPAKKPRKGAAKKGSEGAKASASAEAGSMR